MCRYIRYVFLFVLMFLLGNGVSGRKKRKSGDKRVRKPEFESPFLEINAKLNQSVCIPCKLKTRYQEPSNAILIAWYKDGSPIKVNLNPHYKQEEDCLRIEKITSYDHGKYQCQGFNRLGSTEAVRFLNVTNRLPLSIPPALPTVKIRQRTDIPYIFRDTIEVIKPLVRKTVGISKKMKIKCLLKGEPTPEVYWLFNGQLVLKNKKHRLRDRNKILVIKKFASADTGKYTCIGSNPAGEVNMTYVVTPKRKPRPSPTPPSVITTKLIVKQGQNLTLTCKVPAKEIRYLIWNVPSRPTTSDNSVERGFRSGDLGRDIREKTQRHFLKRGITRNGTRIEKSILVNATKEVHEGVYKCVGLFERQTKVQTIKVVEVIVETNSPLQARGSTGENEFPLNIVLPAACVAFFLMVLFLCICFVFRQKSRQSKSLLIPIVPPPAQTFDREEEDQSNMQILPMCNYDSLKTNSSNNKSNRSSQRTSTGTIQGDENNKLIVRTTIDIDCSKYDLQNSRKNSTNSKRNSSSSISSLSNQHTTSSNSTNNVVTQLVADTSHTSPSTCNKFPPDSDNIEDSSSNDEEERLLVEYPNIARTCTYSKHSNTDTHELDPPPDNKAVEKLVPTLVDKGGDLHVQRKIKNWEPLIRTSCPVNAIETRAAEEKLRSP